MSHRGRCSRSQQQVHCTSANRISVGERRGGEGRRLKVSYTRLIQQHKHRDHEEYWCYTGNMNVIDVIIIIVVVMMLFYIICYYDYGYDYDYNDYYYWF